MELKYQQLVDDPERIPNDEILYRRISWQGARPVDGEVPRLVGNGFADYSLERALQFGYPAPCMSVAVHSVLLADSKSASVELDGFEGHGLAQITAGVLRNLSRPNGTPCPQGIMLAPEPSRPWHAVVFGLNGGRRPNAAKDAIAAFAEWHTVLLEHTG